MNPCDIIAKKRLGRELTELEIRNFIDGVVDGSFSDCQICALLMAVCINGMSDRETLALTQAMAKSGEKLNWKDVPGIKADKHAVGGVGDATTLILTPLVAACGVKIAKMSGGGMNYNDDTSRKLESILGCRVHMENDGFKKQVQEVGCAVMGRSKTLAPAESTLYALRDMTATLESIPLTTSSILAQKLATGCDVVVLDVKTGSGSTTGSYEEAKRIAEKMVKIGNLSGKRFAALLTNMDQPLGNGIGNVLEIKEAIEILSGRCECDLKRVALTLGAHILKYAGHAASVEAGMKMLQGKIDDGSGLKKLAEMVSAQGGDSRVIFDAALLPESARKIPVKADGSGYVAGIDTFQFVRAANLLGAGHIPKEDRIDQGTGIVLHFRIGDYVKRGATLCTLHVGKDSDYIGAYNMIRRAVTLSKEIVPRPTLIYEVVEA